MEAEGPSRSLLSRMFLEEDEDATDRQGDSEVKVEDDDEDRMGSDGQFPQYEGQKVPFTFSWKKLWRFAGPGWLMSLAYLDPGNLESDLQQGAYTGLTIVWILFWATVMGLILQEMSARLGVVTGRDLAQTMRTHYPPWLTYTVYVMMEVAVIGSDIQEVVGSAIALQLLFGLKLWVGCLITGIDTFTFLLVHFLGVRYLEALITLLIATMTICFFVNWGESGTDAGELFFGWVVPTMPAYALTQAVGTIGAVIMPHNLYLHSGLVLSRKINRSSPRAIKSAIVYNFLESAGALLLAFLANLAVVATNSANFYDPDVCSVAEEGPLACISPAAFARSGDAINLTKGFGLPCTAGHHSDTTVTGSVCGEVGLQAEGYALSAALGGGSDAEKVADSGICGSFPCFVWALGLLAAGQAATMTCTYAGQIIMGGCLRIALKPFARVMVTRIVALGPAFAIALLSQDAGVFSNVNEYLNILQSVQLPFAMLPVLHFSRSAVLMGRFRSSAFMIVTTNLLALGVMAINFYLVITFLDGVPPWGVALVALYGAFYLFLCLAMITGGGFQDSFDSLKRWVNAGAPIAPQVSGSMSGSMSNPHVASSTDTPPPAYVINGSAPLMAHQSGPS